VYPDTQKCIVIQYLYSYIPTTAVLLLLLCIYIYIYTHAHINIYLFIYAVLAKNLETFLFLMILKEFDKKYRKNCVIL